MSICENEIVVVQLEDKLTFERDTAEVFLEAIKSEVIKTGKILLIAGEETSADDGARKYFARAEHRDFLKKSAIVIHSPAQKLVGNFYLKINKPSSETKLFTDINQAWQWLVGEERKK